MYDTNNQRRQCLGQRCKSSLCDYSNAYIFVNRTMTVSNIETAGNPNNRKNIIIKSCAPFTECINEMSNTQIDNAKNIYIVMQCNTLEMNLL